MTINILIGILLASISIWGVTQIYPKREANFWRMGLIIVALIYVGFVIFGQAWEHLPMELGGLAVYGLFAFLSKRYSLYWLSLGWLFHVGWDIFIPVHQHAGFVPNWYPGFCLGFDVVIALYIFWFFQKSREEVKEK